MHGILGRDLSVLLAQLGILRGVEGAAECTQASRVDGSGLCDRLDVHSVLHLAGHVLLVNWQQLVFGVRVTRGVGGFEHRLHRAKGDCGDHGKATGADGVGVEATGTVGIAVGATGMVGIGVGAAGVAGLGAGATGTVGTGAGSNWGGRTQGEGD